MSVREILIAVLCAVLLASVSSVAVMLAADAVRRARARGRWKNRRRL